MSENEEKKEELPEVATLDSVALSATEKALSTMMLAIAGIGNKLETITDIVGQQRTDIEELKKGTPAKVLRPLDGVIGDEDHVPEVYDLDDYVSGKTSGRRSSYMASDHLQSEFQPDVRSGGGGGKFDVKSDNDTTVTLLKVQKEVPAHLQIDSVSIPSLIFALETQQRFTHENNQRQKLVKFLTPNFHKELIKNEDQLSTALSMLLNVIEGHIFTLPDNVIISMVASTVRHKYTTSRNLLARTVMGLTRQLKSSSSAWKFGIVGYDKHMHARLVEWLKNVRRGWKYLCVDISVAEQSVWPKERWGSRETPGLIRVFAEGLGEYEASYIRAIGEDKIKKMESIVEFLDALETEDKKLCEKALKLRRDDAMNEEPISLKDLRDSMSRGPGSERIAERPHENARSARYGDAHYPATPGYGGNRDQTPEARRGGFPRLTVLDEPEVTEDGDRSMMSDTAFAPVMPMLTPGKTFDFDNETNLESDLLAMMGRGATAMGSAGKQTLYDSKAKTPGDPTKPCFVEFRTGCDNKCAGYSHDPVVMEKFAFKTLEDLVHSKYGGRERTQRNLDKIVLAMNTSKSGSPPDRYQPSRPRVALVTGDPHVHPGTLIPAGFFEPDDASSETS